MTRRKMLLFFAALLCVLGLGISADSPTARSYAMVRNNRAARPEVLLKSWDFGIPPTRYWKNPIIPLGGSGSWYHAQIYDPNILVDPSNPANLIGYFSGMATVDTNSKQTIGRFDSTITNPYSWSEHRGNGNGQVLLPGAARAWDSTYVRLGTVLYNTGDKKFYLYYSGYNGTRAGIGLATSTDGVTFEKHSDNPILTPGAGEGDSLQVPCVVKDGSTWKMVYMYKRGDTSYGTNYRSATSSDGQSWTKTGNGDLLTSPAGPEFHCIQKIGGVWLMLFEDGNGSTAFTNKAATTSDPVTAWTTLATPPNPIQAKSTVTGAWDGAQVATPFLVLINGTWRLFYAGNANKTWPLGIADFTPFADCVLDRFVDTNGTALSSHIQDVGGGWKAVTGTFQIQSNTCQSKSSAAGDMTVTDAGASDVRLQVDYSTTNGPQIILRYTDSTHHWLLDTFGGRTTLYENTGSGYVSRATGTSVGPGTTRQTIILSGTSIAVLVNGVTALTYSSMSSNQTATKFGFRVGQSATCTWSNFRIRAAVGTISTVQETVPTRTSSGSSLSAAFTQNVTAGDSVIVSAFGTCSSALVGAGLVSDTQGNSYVADAFVQDGTNHEYAGIWRCSRVSSSGALTVTVNLGHGGQKIEMTAREVSPAVTLDQAKTATGTGTAPAAGRVSTTQTNEYLAAVFASVDSSNPATVTTQVGLTALDQQLNGSKYLVGEMDYALLNALAHPNPAWTTDSSSAWAAAQATYKVAVAIPTK
jgi:hypothetical protein